MSQPRRLRTGSVPSLRSSRRKLDRLSRSMIDFTRLMATARRSLYGMTLSRR
jgi:hypothetical protein